ncbi:hypothetical protein [Sphingobacterium faecale]|uniref:Uncharacterized protein n=1 Tax=Sphingobacterium faecale TaxID=2803775 RepID=A0ABS1RA19_9SPHI|nr:hypothetical protein [Sphingobacterium faecale]MBL1411518.1 hypothetical protein [Sphingobacterium faecale]
MKTKFDNAGVSRVEHIILELAASERRIETDYLRAQPVQWIDEHFDLTQRQQEQLQSIDPVFLQCIATAVADSWDQGRLISFYKEEPSARQSEDRSPKDIIFSRQSTQSLTLGQAPEQALEQTAIWIWYR